MRAMNAYSHKAVSYSKPLARTFTLEKGSIARFREVIGKSDL